MPWQADSFWSRMMPRSSAEWPGLVHALAFQPNSHVLAMAGDDAMIRLWDVDAERLTSILAGHVARITCLAWCPDGTGIASGIEDRTVRIWDVQRGKMVGSPLEFDNPIAHIGWSSQQEFVAISTADRVYVRDVAKVRTGA
ncbi:MAG: WD40 repeat domain-containing protein [Pirellulaceae bacterium]